MKTFILALFGLCYLLLIIHVIRTLWGYYHPPRPHGNNADVMYMGKPASVVHRGTSRSLIVMKNSGARVWAQNKNIKY